MTINAATISRVASECEEITFTLLLDTGNPCKKIGVEELKALAANGHVCARWRGGRILSVQLIVPADVAFGRIGETVRHIRESLHSSAASQTTQQAGEHLPRHIKKHHAMHCSNWPTSTPNNYAGAVDGTAI
jgi:hypothetical protein